TSQWRRWRNPPRLAAYVQALGDGTRPKREVERLPLDVRRRERVMLGLRLDEPLRVDELATVLDHAALSRLERLGLVERELDETGDRALALTRRGRFLGGGVTAGLLACAARRIHCHGVCGSGADDAAA